MIDSKKTRIQIGDRGDVHVEEGSQPDNTFDFISKNIIYPEIINPTKNYVNFENLMTRLGSTQAEINKLCLLIMSKKRKK